MKNFNNIYEAVYKKYAEPMEEKRKAARNGLVLVTLMSLALGIILTIITGHGLFLIIAIVVMVLYIAMSKNNKEYKAFFKNNIIKTFIKEYSETLEYIPEQGITPSTYKEGEFETYYDRYTTEDLIQGVLDDQYTITMAEIHTEREDRDEDGHTSYTTIFHGLFAKVEFTKMVNANIKIRRNVLLSKVKKDKLEMDSAEFEKKFDVYSTDKIMAMQLLTADIMQILLDFRENNKVTPEMTLKENKLYIRFATGNMFEPNLMKSSLEYDKLKKYYDTINFTLNITKQFLKNVQETEL